MVGHSANSVEPTKADSVGTLERCLACEAERSEPLEASRFNAGLVSRRFFVVSRVWTGKRENHRKTSGSTGGSRELPGVCLL